MVDLTKVLAEIRAHTGHEAARALPPVERWDPPDCGDIGMQIRRDFSWWHQGGRIHRAPMVRLFSTILRKEADGRTFLVTPYEKVRVDVADVAFSAIRVDMVEDDDTPADTMLVFTTNVGDIVTAGPDHPLTLRADPATGEPAPYLGVRGRLEARLTRSVFYELAEIAHHGPDGRLGVASNGQFFALEP